jgi:hypothetical protein
MVIHSSFPDFLLFLYVHLAHVDSTYDPKELSTIKSRMARLFPAGTDLEKKLYLAIREYNAFDRSRLDELCKDSFLHFDANRDAEVTAFIADAHTIMNADGQVLESEMQALASLRKLMEHA